MSTWSDVMSVDGQYISIAWHPLFPILAASTDNRVDCFTEHGQKIEKSTLKKDSAKPASLTWHPTKKLLASGWSNGILIIWNELEQSSKEAIGHNGPITLLLWSPNGQRLVSADSDGQVVVWRCDIRGRLTSLCQYRLKSAVTHCIFRTHGASFDFKSNDSSVFFLATLNGSIYYSDDAGHCSDDIKISSSIVSMLMLESTDTLIVVDEDLLLSQYVYSDGKFIIKTEFKLSASNKVEKRFWQIDWVNPGVLALCSAGNMIKMWDLISEESFNLACTDGKLICFAYNALKSIISASTDTGYFMMWKKRVVNNDRTVAWELCSRISTALNIRHLQWSSSGSIAVAITSNGLTFFAEQILSFKLYQKIAAVQISSNKLLLTNAPHYKLIELGASMKIKNIALSQGHLAISNGSLIEVFEMTPDLQSVEQIASIQMNSLLVHLDASSIVVGTLQRINICNYQGTIKQFIKIEEAEGELSHLHVTNTHLLLATSNFVVKTYDISRREPRLLISRTFEEFVPFLILPSFVSLTCIKMNNIGNYISLFAVVKDKNHSGLHTQMMLYNPDSDKLIPMVFGDSNVTPTTQYWDTTDNRIIVCEVEGFFSSRSAEPSATAEIITSYREVFTMFATPETGFVVQDRKFSNDDGKVLLGIAMPFHYYLRGNQTKDLKYTIDDSMIEKRAIRDFEAMKNADEATIKASIDFSFHLSMGNMDEAFKCIHSIKNKTVWEHMARICVKTKRIDVAMICLSNVGSSHTIRALREASKEPEIDVQTAILATYLGLIPEAEQLLIACNRYDLLNRIYQANGQWDKSLELSGSKDRINLRTTYYKFGKYLHENGDVSGSLAAFEKSASCSFEIPRMLLVHNGGLEGYIKASDDKNLKKWWAQFCESQGDYASALLYYEEACDILSTVRVHCYAGNLEQAIEITNRTQNASAAYHIARHYENDSKIKDAIIFYTAAKCFNHAIRLAKQYKLETELMHLALQGSKESMLEVARYYEGIPKNHDKAVHLFFKAGHVSRAIDICFQTKQFDILADIVDGLQKDTTDPKILRKCAAHFYEAGKFEKAVSLLIKADECNEAIDICIQKSVHISEEMANLITMGIPENTTLAKAVLIRVAECCMQQRSFLLASKNYTQAGDRIKAMKALLQSGDTDKIIFFANALGSKQKEIFVMVANYLQTLDWRSSTAVMKAIISFYTKAKALDSLAAFYESCGQVEIDEYQNYEKGLAAFNEVNKCFAKSKNVAEAEIKMKNLRHKIELIQKFVEAKQNLKNDPNSNTWLDICETLLQDRNIDDAVKSGDIYALMIEKKYACGSHQIAFELLERMRQKISSANIDYYLDANIVRGIEQEQARLQHHPQEPDLDHIREDIQLR